jgi:hypothetical protein
VNTGWLTNGVDYFEKNGYIQSNETHTTVRLYCAWFADFFSRHSGDLAARSADNAVLFVKRLFLGTKFAETLKLS